MHLMEQIQHDQWELHVKNICDHGMKESDLSCTWNGWKTKTKSMNLLWVSMRYEIALNFFWPEVWWVLLGMPICENWHTTHSTIQDVLSGRSLIAYVAPTYDLWFEDAPACACALGQFSGQSRSTCPRRSGSPQLRKCRRGTMCWQLLVAQNRASVFSFDLDHVLSKFLNGWCGTQKIPFDLKESKLRRNAME